MLTGIPGTPRVHRLAELDELLARATAGQLHLSAYHPTGTVAAGSGPWRFSVDPHGRFRAVHGVLVADASMLPRCPQVNPQFSIRAAALAITEAHAGA
ncbi:GMC oxidoreductase [Streptomyces griseoluteus]|uniref:GMC oxidoreductase n=1 Tax=Streptomyces griseoluteus TaxID=29306 RepID=UPI0034144A3F